MIWFSLALAGSLPQQLDKSMQRWFRGAAPVDVFKNVSVQLDGGLRATLRERGVTHLEFVGMELELVIQQGKHTKTLRLFLDPRKPARPVVRSLEIKNGSVSRAHPVSLWARRAPAIKTLAARVMAGLRESRCPASWGDPALPIGLPEAIASELDGMQAQALERAESACALALNGTLTAIMVDDISWFAYAEGVPIGALRSELELGREGLAFEFGGIRTFPR